MVTAIAVSIGMVCTGIAAPVALALIWIKRTKEPLEPLLIGAAVFLVFAVGLESLPKLVLLQGSNPWGRFVLERPMLTVLVAALLAGIFEETGRFLAFRFVLKKHTGRKTAITFGIGHGGIEVAYLLALGGLTNLVYLFLMKTGAFDAVIAQAAASAPEQAEALKAIPEALAGLSFLTLLLSAAERAGAMLLHLTCSVLVFASVHKKEKRMLYPLSILLHASMDVFAGMYQLGMIRSVYALEAGLLAAGILMFALCRKRVYQKLPPEGKAEAAESAAADR